MRHIKPKTFGAMLSLLAFVIMAGAVGAANYTPWSPAVAVEELNTEALEGCPGVARDGLTLYFASTRPGGLGMTDIWVTTRSATDQPWSEPSNPGAPLNSAFAELCPSPLNGGHILFVSNRPGGCGGNDLYSTQLHPVKGWLAPENLGCNVNSASQDITPSLVEQSDGTFLYFASNRPGGFSTEERTLPDDDIYVSQLQGDGSFGPGSLVPGINTASNDSRPNVSKDGREIFFDSDRLPGYGLSDLWSSSRDTTVDGWPTPSNLGPDVNSPANEMRAFLSWDGTLLYFGSTRPGEGSQDLYFTTRERLAGAD